VSKIVTFGRETGAFTEPLDIQEFNGGIH